MILHNVIRSEDNYICTSTLQNKLYCSGRANLILACKKRLLEDCQRFQALGISNQTVPKYVRNAKDEFPTALHSVPCTRSRPNSKTPPVIIRIRKAATKAYVQLIVFNESSLVEGKKIIFAS